MASAIDDTKPIAGTPTTQSVRDNFATAKSEITALQAREPTWTVGSVPFATSTTALGQDNANLFWDDTNNRLGLGTTTPASLLDLKATTSPALKFHETASGVTATDGFEVSFGSLTGYVWNYEAGPIDFATSNTGRMRIDAAGLVGIGTTGAIGRLALSGAGQATASIDTGGVLTNTLVLDDSGAGAGNGGAILFTANSQAWRFASIQGLITNGSSNTQGDITVSTRRTAAATTLTEAMRVYADGGVTIGAPTGASKSAGTLNAVTVYGNNVVLTSDADLKTDIVPLGEALPLVAQIEPKSFKWRPLEVEGQPAGFTEWLNRGFIADEVKAILGGPDGGVDLGGMVAILWQAVRELSDRVDELEGDKPAPQH